MIMFYVEFKNEFRGRFNSMLRAMQYACLLKKINSKMEKDLTITFK